MVNDKWLMAFFAGWGWQKQEGHYPIFPVFFRNTFKFERYFLIVWQSVGC